MIKACIECGHVFDLSNATDNDEWHHGHDCEAPSLSPEATRLERFRQELIERMPDVQLLHDGCEKCAELVHVARTHAAVTGSTGATWRDKSSAGVHEARVGSAVTQ